jgi:hypothetical protein
MGGRTTKRGLVALSLAATRQAERSLPCVPPEVASLHQHHRPCLSPGCTLAERLPDVRMSVATSDFEHFFHDA